MAGDAEGARSGGASRVPLDAEERAELDALRARLPERHRLRSALASLLIILAALLAPLSVVAVWVADDVADTDRYVRTVEPLASKPDVQAAVTANVTTAIMRRIDIDTLLSQVAPDKRPGVKEALGALNAPITEGVRNLVRQTVATFVASDAFRTLWAQLNRRAHAAFVGALTGDSGTAVRVEGDTVTLDLAPVVEQVKQRLVDSGLTVASNIPPVQAQYTLIESENVKRAQTGFRVLQLAGNWLPVVTVLLAAGGVLLAARRRRALATVALAVAATVAGLGIGLSVFRIVYLDRLPAKIDERAAGTVYDQMVHFLRESVLMVIVLGVVVALSAWLSGAGRWAVRVRAAWVSAIAAVRQAVGVSTGPVGSWVHRYRHLLHWLVVLVAAVVLVLWSYPTGMVVFWIALAALGALAAVEFLDDRRRPGGRTGSAA
ncbi:putative integral membrane protein [Actinacidiphila reveromycinica]|uniref:Putative integral membrane protein n=1 Tax=Actinacidiphila reveromycinica TaxID=659352 RepID=A0A7U3UP77_9ACTN|nr:hypothetical protein [Streptomyces sp. SN-593]BBA97845.1 putative integral membrane protein [Streptomyces sp. SN-593]